MAAYRGINFPFKRGRTAFPEPVSDDALIKQSLIQIVLTPTGSRVMRPDFGTRILSFLFESNDVLLGNLIRAEVSSAIARFEPRVTVEGVQIDRDDSTIVLTIGYTVKTTQQQQRVAMQVEAA